MKISKIREVKTPTRANPTDAGIDFYIPEYNENFIKDLESKNPYDMTLFNQNYIITSNKGITLNKHRRYLIPSGIKVNVPKGYALIAFNKSGVATKKGLDVLACIVDENYQGEVHISIVNTNNYPINLDFGEKIIQFILLPVLYDKIEEVKIEELYENISKRGESGFGSTGK